MDRKNLLALPRRAVDAQMNAGSYGAVKESGERERAAAQGGVTSMLTLQHRSQYYLQKGEAVQAGSSPRC